MGHVVHYLCAIYALINLAKVSGRMLFCNDLLSSSSATLAKCQWIEVKNIFCYLNTTGDFGVHLEEPMTRLDIMILVIY